MAIKGKRIIIKQTIREDLENIKCLWNNVEVMKWVGFPAGIDQNINDLKEWWEKIQQNEKTHHFVVYTKKNDNFCGELYYKKDAKHKRAGLDIKLLPQMQGRGLATESLQLLISYIFKNEPQIEAVWTEPSEENAAARKLYSRCGLKSKERPTDMKPAASYWELTRKDWQKNNSNFR